MRNKNKNKTTLTIFCCLGEPSAPSEDSDRARYPHAGSEISYQTGLMLRLIRVFVGCTGYFVLKISRKCVYEHNNPNYTLAYKQNVSQIKANPNSTSIFVTQWHRLFENE